jgi:hypothetical protein
VVRDGVSRKSALVVTQAGAMITMESWCIGAQIRTQVICPYLRGVRTCSRAAAIDYEFAPRLARALNQCNHRL